MNGTLRRFSIFAATAVIASLSAFLAQAQPPPPKMEAGTISNVDQSFQTIPFQERYDTPPVVFTLLPNANSSPSLLRIRNVTTSGFDIAQLESNNVNGGAGANDGITTPDTVDYFAIETGVHTVGGLKFAAGTHTTTNAHVGGGSENYQSVNFGDTFTDPVVLAFVQTMNNAGVTTLSTRLDDTNALSNASSFDVQLERAEDTTGTITNAETIGFLAIEAGTTTFTAPDGTEVTIEALNSNDNIGDGNQSVSFNALFDDEPLTVGNLVRDDGGDGGWLRQASVSASDITLFTQEDQFNDSELGHTAEAAGIFAISDVFSTLVIPEPTTIAIWTLLGLIGAGFAWRSRKR